MRVTIYSRFAGNITIEPATLDETTPAVTLKALGSQLDLYPDEARLLSLKLIEAAAKAERAEQPEWP